MLFETIHCVTLHLYSARKPYDFVISRLLPSGKSSCLCLTFSLALKNYFYDTKRKSRFTGQSSNSSSSFSPRYRIRLQMTVSRLISMLWFCEQIDNVSILCALQAGGVVLHIYLHAVCVCVQFSAYFNVKFKF